MSVGVLEYSAPDLVQLAKDWELSDHLRLPSGSRIAVAGAYQGKLIRLLAEMFPDYARIEGWEPQQEMAQKASDNIKHIRSVAVTNIGLLAGPGTVELPMGEYGTDACSVLGGERQQGVGIFYDAVTVLDRSGILTCDLFVMNMEGYEYKLLPYLLEHYRECPINSFAVQFHVKYAPDRDEVNDLLNRMKDRYGPPVYENYPRWVYWVRQ